MSLIKTLLWDSGIRIGVPNPNRVGFFLDHDTKWPLDLPMRSRFRYDTRRVRHGKLFGNHNGRGVCHGWGESEYLTRGRRSYGYHRCD